MRRLGIVARQIDDEELRPVDAILDRFRRCLSVERALAAVTTRNYVHFVRPFLQGRLSSAPGLLDVKNLSARDIVTLFA